MGQINSFNDEEELIRWIVTFVLTFSFVRRHVSKLGLSLIAQNFQNWTHRSLLYDYIAWPRSILSVTNCRRCYSIEMLLYTTFWWNCCQSDREAARCSCMRVPVPVLPVWAAPRKSFCHVLRPQRLQAQRTILCGGKWTPLLIPSLSYFNYIKHFINVECVFTYVWLTHR